MLIKFVHKNLEFCARNKQLFKVFARSISTSKVLNLVHGDFIVKSPRAPLKYPKVSIDQYVWTDCEKWMNKTAIVDGITDRSITYAKLRDKCRTLAVRLRTTLKLEPNDTIALCLPNSIEFPIIALGACEAELIITTVNPIYTSDEISRQILDSNAKILFGHARMSKVLKLAVEKTKKPMKIVYATDSTSDSIPAEGIRLDELLDNNGLELTKLPETERETNTISFLPYSSGTTGLSKGVMLSHMNIISNCLGLRCEDVGVTFDSIGNHQDILPCVLPFFHIYGLVVTLVSKLAQGCKMITLPRFNPDTFLNAMEKYHGTVLHLVPPIVIFLNSYDKIRPVHTKSIQRILSGAAPLGSSDIEQFLKDKPHIMYTQAYGLTESSPVTHIARNGSKKYASVGAPISDTEAKIVDFEDSCLRGVGPNRTGEILVRGPLVMLGYHNNEKATKEIITPDGWLRTGDIGYHDEDGDFYITDRLKELIKVKGFQVAPAELEEILRTHSEISDAAVVGVPNEATGELPRAFIVTTKGSKLSEKMVQDYVADKVSQFKRLTGGVEFVEAIPKNATGKILRRELKKKCL